MSTLVEPFSFDSDVAKYFFADKKDNLQRIVNLYDMLHTVPSDIHFAFLKNWEIFTSTFLLNQQTEFELLTDGLLEEGQKLKKAFSTEPESGPPVKGPVALFNYTPGHFSPVVNAFIVLFGVASLYAALTVVAPKDWDISLPEPLYNLKEFSPLYNLKELSDLQFKAIADGIYKLLVDNFTSVDTNVESDGIVTELGLLNVTYAPIFKNMKIVSATKDNMTLSNSVISYTATSLTKFAYEFIYNGARVSGDFDLSYVSLDVLKQLLTPTIGGGWDALFNVSLGTMKFWNAFAPSVPMICFVIGFTTFMLGDTLNGWKSSLGAVYLLLTLFSLGTFCVAQYAALEPVESVKELAAMGTEFMGTIFSKKQSAMMYSQFGEITKGLFAVAGTAAGAFASGSVTTVISLLGLVAAGGFSFASAKAEAEDRMQTALFAAVGSQVLYALGWAASKTIQATVVPFVKAFFKAVLTVFPTDPITKDLGRWNFSRFNPVTLYNESLPPGKTNATDLPSEAGLALASSGGNVMAAAKVLAKSGIVF